MFDFLFAIKSYTLSISYAVTSLDKQSRSLPMSQAPCSQSFSGSGSRSGSS